MRWRRGDDRKAPWPEEITPETREIKEQGLDGQRGVYEEELLKAKESGWLYGLFLALIGDQTQIHVTTVTAFTFCRLWPTTALLTKLGRIVPWPRSLSDRVTMMHVGGHVHSLRRSSESLYSFHIFAFGNQMNGSIPDLSMGPWSQRLESPGIATKREDKLGCDLFRLQNSLEDPTYPRNPKSVQSD